MVNEEFLILYAVRPAGTPIVVYRAFGGTLCTDRQRLPASGRPGTPLPASSSSA